MPKQAMKAPEKELATAIQRKKTLLHHIPIKCISPL